MLINRETWRLHRPWILFFGIGLLICIALLFSFDRLSFSFPGGSSTVGYLSGVAAGLIIVFEVLLWPRKKLFRRWRIGRTRTWVSAHIWLGLLTVPLAIVHAGIPWGGAVASATMVLLFLVVGSGIFGLLMQQWIPKKMTESVPNETVYSQTQNVNEQFVVEADAFVSAVCGTSVGSTDWASLNPVDKTGGDGVQFYVGANRTMKNSLGTSFVSELPAAPIPGAQIIQAAYETTIRDYLLSGKSSKLADESGQTLFFGELAEKVTPEARYVVQQLKDWCLQRRGFVKQRYLHHWLHLWLAIHLPLSIALLVLTIWHAVAATLYSGIF